MQSNSEYHISALQMPPPAQCRPERMSLSHPPPAATGAVVPEQVCIQQLFELSETITLSE